MSTSAHPPLNALFLCTHNSARSIMAEAILNAIGRGRFAAYSAGSMPKSAPNPLALQTLAKLGLPTAGLHSKSWDVFATPDAPKMDFVFTVCDNAAGEVCPVWPGQPVTAHWGVADPSECEGSEEQKLREFARTAQVLKHRIGLLLELPVESLDRQSLQRELREIAAR
jgi:arsenate reductase